MKIIMKRVGILSFHRASNYGAVLQAYALQTAFHKIGADAEIIDYRCQEVENAHNPKFFIKSHGIKSILRMPGKIKKYRVFDRFRKERLKLSEMANASNITEIESTYTILVAGSDQLWNDRFSGRDEQYFLPNNVGAHKYTYAISVGDIYDPEFLRNNLVKYGDSISTLSLRENSSLDFISSITRTKCRVDVDPTLLLSKEDWLSIAEKPKIKKPYILIYTVAEPDLLIEKAIQMSRLTGYQIIYLNSSFSNIPNVKKIRFSSPEGFIGWFSEAAYVFTNSFHGTAFSIIMNKPFVIEDHSIRGKNIRSLDLIEKFKVGDRCINNKKNLSIIQDINWEIVNRLKFKYTQESLVYLRNMISPDQI